MNPEQYEALTPLARRIYRYRCEAPFERVFWPLDRRGSIDHATEARAVLVEATESGRDSYLSAVRELDALLPSYSPQGLAMALGQVDNEGGQ